MTGLISAYTHPAQSANLWPMAYSPLRLARLIYAAGLKPPLVHRLAGSTQANIVCRLFSGTRHIGYIARERLFGCNKLARIADMYAQRLQLRERLTGQISATVQETIHADGVGVMI